MLIVTVMYLVFAGAIYIGFIQAPAEVGLTLEDQTAENTVNKEIELFQTDLSTSKPTNCARNEEEFELDRMSVFFEANPMPA